MLLEGLPIEIVDEEILPHLSAQDLLVLTGVSRAFMARFEPECKFVRFYNPLEYYSRIGSLGLVEWDLCGPAPSVLTSAVFVEACRGGNVEVVDYLFAKGCPLPFKKDYLIDLCASGDLRMIKFLIGKDLEFPKEAIEEAVIKKQKEAFISLLDAKCASSVNMLEIGGLFADKELFEKIISKFGRPCITMPFLGQVAASGNVETFRWAAALFSKDSVKRSIGFLVSCTARAGSTAILDVLASIGPIPDYAKTRGVILAVENGHVEILLWFERHGKDLIALLQNNNWLWIVPARIGCLEVIRFGVEYIGINLTPMLWNYAVRSNNVELVKYLESQGPPEGSLTDRLRQAVYRERKPAIEMATYLIESAQNVPKKLPCSFLAEAGSIPLMKLAMSTVGFTDNPNTEITLAMEGGHFDLLRYCLEELKHPFNENSLVSFLGKHPNEEIMLYLISRGFTIKTAEVKKKIWLRLLRDPYPGETIVPYSHFQLKLLDRMGLTIEKDVIISAAKSLRFDLLKWMYETVGGEIDFEALLRNLKLRKMNDKMEKYRYMALNSWLDRLPPIRPKPKTAKVLVSSRLHTAIRTVFFFALIAFAVVLAVWLLKLFILR